MNGWLLLGACVAGGLLGVAYLSALEGAVAGSSRVRLRHRAATGVWGAAFAESLVQNPERLLGFTLVGTTLSFALAATAAAAGARALLAGWLSQAWAAPAAAAVVVPAMVLLGDVLPRALARRAGDRALLWLARPVHLTSWVLYGPVVALTGAASAGFRRLLRIERPTGQVPAAREELRRLLRQGESQGVVALDQRAMIEGIFELHGKSVAQCLTRRDDIKALDRGATVGQVARYMIETGFSRIPLYERTLDQLVGQVHAFDVLTTSLGMEERADLIMQELATVPRDKRLAALLRDFQATSTQMARVAGDAGETLGLITLEDLLEEIVGEIRDEFDQDEPAILKVSPAVFLVDARVSKREFERYFGAALPAGAYDTVGGFLLHLFRRIPAQGEERRYGGMSFSIVRADAHKVLQARVILLPEAGAPRVQTKADAEG